MRRLVITLLVLLAAEIGADVAARAWSESQITTRAKSEVPSDVHVASDIPAFPFLLPLLVAGRVSEVDGHFENVHAGPLLLAAVDIRLHGVRVDRDRLLTERKVSLVGVHDGTVSADITAGVLSQVLHVPVTIESGQVKVTVGGVTAVAHVRVVDNRLLLDVGGVPPVAIPRTNLLPCATGATVLAGRVRVSCVIRRVPAALLGIANRRLGDG